MSTETGQHTLDEAWTGMIAALNRAREAIISPDLHAPEVTALGIAEGHRYLMGFAFSAIERAFCEDPDFPYFRRAIQPIDKATIDNADALYLSAAIDGAHSYRIRGRLADGAKPPQYMIFEAHTVYAGDSGSLAELGPGGRVVTGILDTSGLLIDDDGKFEILLAPQRPDGHTGNFLRSAADGITARYVIARMLFHDWENEASPDLHIAQIGKEGSHPGPIEPETAAVNLRRVGELVENQMRFWNEFYDIVLESNGDKNGDGVTFMPRNALNTPMGANLATGGGQSTNVYSGGVYDLAEGEVLLVEVTVPAPPEYMGFHLSNLWGESLDYANRISSLNGFQAEPDPDGTLRYVIADSDPGVPNWLDTCGHRTGFLTLRWTYSEPTSELPATTVTVMPQDQVAARLPDTTRRVTEAERRDQVRIRQEHVQRRYRQY
ncbi:DUF1214 domain-containing protein [Mycolicibacterium boenickei]|uniref:DUF1214 domain-containing protein n=1 Tax=Mycolicibacterium boenickei TaxID=146017 RepID=A0AAX3A322_9MYCO|nr:DUF1214 domain-containing protein [Mycolicibacterium boenickei]PEG56800.1 DUF1214 domain-containing protein [Mycolicibacterium boenickei]UNC01301.1 DUF1214 domain-containing protein [Mycolicibacterium boenickei]BBX91168.1 hypothetical protein MBOE_28170 [Mycolicibacterium boenickei]